jgi:molecular chaperone HtpG
MVAKKVMLTTRRAGAAPETAVRWESDGGGEYTIEPARQDARGTEIVIELREGEDEFLAPARLRSVIRKYSDHVALPVRMRAGDGADGEWETVNKAAALWTRPRSEIRDEEYQAFYASIAYDEAKPFLTLHHRVEGKLDYTFLLFVPGKAPFDLWDRDHPHGVKLYVRRIFILDDTKHLLPPYLRFLRGLVDCADLPLNVSREFLQQNPEIERIRAGITKKVLAELARIAEKEPERYAEFWKEFGTVLKEGAVTDAENRSALTDLLRFASTRNEGDEQNVSLSAYFNHMPLKQKAIYYVTADSHAAARHSPQLEVFRKQGVEVLLLTHPIDEWLIGHLHDYRDKPLKSVARGALDLDTEAKPPEGDARMDGIVEKMRGLLKERVKDVRLSARLTESPACLVADEHDMGMNLARILKAAGQSAPASKPILEINPHHPAVLRLKYETKQFDDWAAVLFDQALLAEGGTLDDPATFVKRINQLMLAMSGGSGSGIILES